MAQSESGPHLSVIVPVFNEEGSLVDLHQRLTRTLSGAFASYEIILVDDASRDGTWDLVEDLARRDPHVKGVRFSRNMGEHIAVAAGLNEALGEHVAIMDGDLQDPPESIPVLQERIREGYDLVYAVRRNPQHGILKQWTSSMFWLLLQWFTRLEIPQHQATLRVMTRRFRDALCALPERDRFAYGYGLSALVGFKQLGVEVEHGRRIHGRSSYNMVRRIQVAASAILSLSTFPLRLSFFLGLFFSGTAAACGLDILWLRFFSASAGTGTAIVAAILFVGGIQMMMIGLVGLYVGRMYIQMKPYPPYFISQRTGSS